MSKRTATRGFTLVELLVVMMIIGVLVGLLVPTVARALRTARSTETRSILNNIGLGLEAYKSDFGDYPPSDEASTYPRTGAEKLVFYLRGPTGDGWGAGAAGHLPTGTSRPRTRTYGPYYRADEDDMLWEEVDGNAVPVAFLDAFEPPGRIIYFKAGRDSEGNTTYDWRDNNVDGNRDPDGKTNYSSRTSFQDWTVIGGHEEIESGAYHRNDYLLVSPGQDGRFGAVRRSARGVVWCVLRNQVEEGKASYDDITNWN